MMFNIFKIPVPVSWNGGEENSCRVARSEGEVKEQQARRQHMTKTKITQAPPRNEKKSSIHLGLLGSLSKDRASTFLHSFVNYSKSLYYTCKMYSTYPGARFSKVPKLFGWQSLCIFKTKASRGTKLCSSFNFYPLYNIWEDQLYRISGS